MRLARLRTAGAIVSVLAGLALAAGVYAAACSGSDARQPASSPASTAARTPGPEGAGGPQPPTPPARLLAELQALPAYPGAHSLGNRSTTGLDLVSAYLLPAGTAPPPEGGVMAFYADKLKALGWLEEAGPKADVITWPKDKLPDFEPTQVLMRTWVKGDLRLRMTTECPSYFVKNEVGLGIFLTIEPNTLPAFPTPLAPVATGIPSTPPPLPTPVEPIWPPDAGPIITPTLTPTPALGESPPVAAPTGPTPTPLPTPTPHAQWCSAISQQ